MGFKEDFEQIKKDGDKTGGAATGAMFGTSLALNALSKFDPSAYPVTMGVPFFCGGNCRFG